jgi:hypothetical protein
MSLSRRANSFIEVKKGSGIDLLQTIAAYGGERDVMLLKANHLIDQEIPIPADGLVLKGRGKDNSLITQTAAATNIITCTGKDHIQLRDLSLVLPSAGVTGEGIEFIGGAHNDYGTRQSIVDNLRIWYGSAGHYPIKAENPHESEISNIEMRECINGMLISNYDTRAPGTNEGNMMLRNLWFLLTGAAPGTAFKITSDRAAHTGGFFNLTSLLGLHVNTQAYHTGTVGFDIDGDTLDFFGSSIEGVDTAIALATCNSVRFMGAYLNSIKGETAGINIASTCRKIVLRDFTIIPTGAGSVNGIVDTVVTPGGETSLENVRFGNNFETANLIITALTKLRNVTRASDGCGSETSNTGEIAAAANSVTITHGCIFTPRARDIKITLTNNPTNDPGDIWVNTIDAAHFNVNCRNMPGASKLMFEWAIQRNAP